MLEFSNPIPLEGVETSYKDSTKKENDKRVKSSESMCGNDSKSSNEPRNNEHFSARLINESFLIHDSNLRRQKSIHNNRNEMHFDCNYLKLFGIIFLVIICSLLIVLVLRANHSCKKSSI